MDLKRVRELAGIVSVRPGFDDLTEASAKITKKLATSGSLDELKKLVAEFYATKPDRITFIDQQTHWQVQSGEKLVTPVVVRQGKRFVFGVAEIPKAESASYSWADKPTADVLKKTFQLDLKDAEELADTLASAGPNRAAETAMAAANKALEGHGVEAIRSSDDKGGYWGDTAATYVNMGDSYVATVLYDVKTRTFYVTSMGDFVEKLGDKYELI